MLDITGKKYGRLTVIEPDHKDYRQLWYWRCICECGNETVVSGDKLRRGATKSCGCLQQEHRREGFHRTHGMTNSRLYYEWSNMRSRCLYKRNRMYSRYGGRGIKLCDEWLTFENFMEWAAQNGYSDDLTLERIDVDGNYCPENCCWIPREGQYLNRSDSHFITAFGETKTIKEWADSSGIKYDTIERRINQYGWSAEDAVSIKPWGKKR